MGKIGILIADDHEVVRVGLRALVDVHPDIEVLGEAEDGEEVLRQIDRLSPDILILDIQMPKTVATEIIKQATGRSPQIPVLVLTMHDDPIYVQSVMAAGASGYLIKSTASSLIIDAIRTIHRGGVYLDPSVRTLAPIVPLPHPADKASSAGQAESSASTLSAREREVLALLAQGYTHREIAAQLCISINTVGTFRGRITQKLGLKSRAELASFARHRGLMPPDTR